MGVITLGRAGISWQWPGDATRPRTSSSSVCLNCTENKLNLLTECHLHLSLQNNYILKHCGVCYLKWKWSQTCDQHPHPEAEMTATRNRQTVKLITMTDEFSPCPVTVDFILGSVFIDEGAFEFNFGLVFTVYCLFDTDWPMCWFV